MLLIRLAWMMISRLWLLRMIIELLFLMHQIFSSAQIHSPDGGRIVALYHICATRHH